MNELFKQLNLGIITNIESVDSSQNSVVKVTTLDNEYLVSNIDEPNRINDSISMTKELLNFIKNKGKLLKIYNDIIYRI